jgi:hypothetical protein
LNYGTAVGVRIASFDHHRPNALQRWQEGASLFSCSGKNISEAQLSGVMTSDSPGTDHCCCEYRSVSKSFKCTFALNRALEDSGGYALAAFVASQLLREAFARPVESHFHIGDGSFVKVIGNHFQCPPAILLQDFCLETLGLSVR